MVYTMLKSTCTKSEPKILRNRSYKDFIKESFFQELQHGLNDNSGFAEFNDELKTILNHHALLSNLSFVVTQNHALLKLLEKN